MELFRRRASANLMDTLKQYNQQYTSGMRRQEEQVAEQLAQQLPPLSSLKPFKPAVKGTYFRLYTHGGPRNSLIVKELASYSREKDLMFEKYKQEFRRAYPYFDKYVVPTGFTQRLAENKRDQEFLIVQEMCEGIQGKGIGRSAPRISESMKGQLEDILVRQYYMFQDTGHLLDLDYFLDVRKNRVRLFDLDCQSQDLRANIGTYTRLENLFNIRVPYGLLDESASI